MSRKWEYYTETLAGGPDGWVKDLDRLGQEGWELVTIDSATPYVAILKRPVGHDTSPNQQLDVIHSMRKLDDLASQLTDANYHGSSAFVDGVRKLLVGRDDFPAGSDLVKFILDWQWMR